MSPTPYPQINSLLSDLLAEVQTALGAQFIGLYLYGSLADGDFRPERSDVDFVVLTGESLDADTVAVLAKMHGRFPTTTTNKWAAKLEGAYIPLAEIGRYAADGGPFPQINEGRFFMGGHGADWVIQRHLLRERGVVVAGPPIAPLIEPVTAVDLRRAIAQILQDWWAPMLTGKNRLDEGAYQAFAVLSMCRALYTLARGTAVSKTAAADWARTHLDAKWQPLIDWAREWPQSGQTTERAQVTAFMTYALHEAGVG